MGGRCAVRVAAGPSGNGVPAPRTLSFVEVVPGGPGGSEGEDLKPGGFKVEGPQPLSVYLGALFLPVGYPQSVTPDYLTYQVGGTTNH